MCEETLCLIEQRMDVKRDGVGYAVCKIQITDNKAGWVACLRGKVAYGIIKTYHTTGGSGITHREYDVKNADRLGANKKS